MLIKYINLALYRILIHKKLKINFFYLNKYYNDLIQLKRAKEVYWNAYYNQGLEDLISDKNQKYKVLSDIEKQIKQDRIKSQSKKLNYIETFQKMLS